MRVAEVVVGHCVCVWGAKYFVGVQAKVALTWWRVLSLSLSHLLKGSAQIEEDPLLRV